MTLFFFKSALAAYLISTLGYTVSLLVRRVQFARLSAWVLLVAFILHAISLISKFLDSGYISVTGIHDTLSLFAWLLQLKTKTRVLGAFISPVAFLLMIAASVGLGGTVPLPDVLKGGLVTAHILLSVAGEALFALASCAGAMYLIQDRMIKNKSVGSFSRLLPSLKELDRINHICLLWGFPLLTLGVIVGSVWARTVWGSHWQWDPKQIWTLSAWLLYALLLHQRLAIGWKGHRAALFSLLAFVLLLIGFVLEKAFFTTVHSFL